MIDVEVGACGATCALPGSLPAWAAGQYVQFSFSSEWDGLQKTVYISNGSENAEVLLARDDEAVEIPTWLLDIPHCTMFAGVRGKGDGRTLGTLWCIIGTVSVAAGGGGGGVDTSQFVTKDAMANYYTKPQTDAKIITRTDGAGDEFLADDGAYKATPQPDVSGLATKSELATLDGQLATFGGQLATKANASDIITTTTGDGTLFLANDGSYRAPPTGSGEVNLTNYYTKAQVDALIPDVSGFETAQHAAQTYAKKADVPDVSNFATRAELPDTSGLATKAELGSYALKTEVPAAPDLTPYALKSEIPAAPDLSGYALKSEVPDTSALATKAELGSYALKTEIPSAPDLSSYALKEEIPPAPDLTPFALKTDIITKTDGGGAMFLADDGTYKLVNAGGDPPDLSAYATTAAMNAALAEKASQQDVDELDVAVNALEGQLADKASAMDVATLQGKVEANIAGIAALQTGKADASALASYALKSEIPDTSEFVTGQALQTALAGKADAADIPDVSGFATTAAMNTALAGKADADATAQALAGKADVADIPDVSGLETAAHAEATYAKKADVPDVSGFVTQADLAPYALNADIPNVSEFITAAALEPYAKTEDVPDVSGLATKQELTDGLAGKADAAALASYALKTDVPDASAFATAQALQEGLAGKADASAIPDVSGFATTTAMNEALADKADVSAIPDVSGFATKSEIPDVSGLLTSADAQATYATQDALTAGLEGKVNNDALQYYETAQHAQATYATKAALDAKAETTVTRTAEAGSWGSESTVTVAQTNGDSLQLVKRVDRVGADTKTTLTLDGVALATAADIPDVSSYLTSADAQATYETKGAIRQITQKLLFEQETEGSIYTTKVITPDANGNIEITAAHATWAQSGNTVSGYHYNWRASDKHQDVWDATFYPNSGKGCALEINTHTDATRKPLYVEIGYWNIPLSEGSNERASSPCEVRLLPKQVIEEALAGKADRADTSSFTHTVTSDASDNGIYTDTWQNASGELQKITWKEYAATSGSTNGELYYTGTGETTGSRSVRIATYSELDEATTGIATYDWVREYIASLDGTNMQF